MRASLSAGCLAMLIAGLSGCSTTAYYAQLARGQYELLSRREPIERVVQDPKRDPTLRTRLARVRDAREYAWQTLKLPKNGSYTQYADLGRDYVVWNVFATPEFSLDAVESCFPIAGCVAYRGFYQKPAAETYAATLKDQGYETSIGGVPAYSTLGWFDDPVINTMMRWSDPELVGTLFHELAHQKLYVKNDTAFNESLANFVEDQGRRQYYADKGLDQGGEAAHDARSRQFVQLVLATRESLRTLYAQKLDDATMRERKLAEFESMKARYRELRDGEWAGYKGYDRWFEEPLTNARLLPFGLYDQWVPAFAALWREQHGDWAAFYRAAEEVGALKPAARLERLKALASRNDETDS